MDYLEELYNIFVGLFCGLADIFIYGFTWVLDGLILTIGYTLFYIVDGLLEVLVLIISTIDLSTYVLSFIDSMALLPPQFIYLLQSVGFPQAMAVIGAAYGIRMAINIIPAEFTRI